MQKSLGINLAAILFVFSFCFLQAAEAFAPKYDPEVHFFKADETTGTNIGASLYELKNLEVQDILRRVVDEVNQMTEREVYDFASSKGIQIPGRGEKSELYYLVKKFKIEQEVNNRNLALIKGMNRLPLPQLTEFQKQTRVATVSEDQLIQTSISINFSPATQAIPMLRQKYDPLGNFGYCFLRAHYYANTAGLRGLVRESIKKVFLVGPMQPVGLTPGGGWQFHVATALRGEQGAWMAMDNLMTDYQEEASTVDDWYEYYKKWTSEKEYLVRNRSGQMEKIKLKVLLLYFTDPSKIGASSNAYNAEAFYGLDLDGNGILEGNERVYNGAFIDVDQFLLRARPGVCDPDRYQPLPADHQRCSSKVQVRRSQGKETLLEEWKAIWDEAI